LLPIGEIDDEIPNMLRNRITFYPFKISILENVTLPEEGYNPERGQYESHSLLNIIRKQPGDKVLGICDVDIYSKDYKFVFGQAEISRKVGVISLFRLKGKQDIYYNRIVKEATHELCHTLGLRHCKKSKCVMHFSEFLEDTDHKEENLCPKCEKKLNRQY
jgi:archaemetzincin